MKRLQDGVAKRRSSAHRTMCRYANYCRINDLSFWSARSLLDFVGSVNAQLSAGTTKNIVRDLLHLDARRSGRESTFLLRDLSAEVSTLHAAEKRLQQSTDFASAGSCLQLLRRLPKETKIPLACMLLFGFRFADLQRIRREDVVLESAKKEKRAATFDVYLTKNRRVAGLRTRLKLDNTDLGLCPEDIWKEIVESFSGCPKTKPFGRTQYTEVNDELITNFLEQPVRMHKGPETPRSTPTVGSFRRMFVHRCIDRYTVDSDELGVCTNWEAVIAKTLHRKIGTVIAYYQPSLSLTLARR